MTGQYVHTEHNAVPPLDDELAGRLEDLEGIHAGIDLIRDGIRHLALDRHTIDRTQTVIAGLAGGADGTNLIATIGLLIARLANPDSNPCLRTLPLDQQKTVQQAGEDTARMLTDPYVAQPAAEVCGAIDGI